MKIGIFDSGLGGLGVGLAIMNHLSQYDYLYLGDTLRVPYGNRSQETIYQFTCQALKLLFAEKCGLVIIACNTSSSEALRRIQQEFLPAQFPEKKVLGVLIPAAEVAVEKGQKIGILATEATVRSEAFPREIHKLRSDISVNQVSAPLLVPLIESNGLEQVEPVLLSYLALLKEQQIDTLILGCTHYVFLKNQIRALHPEWKIVSQDEVMPTCLEDYLARHTDLAIMLSLGKSRRFLVTDLTPKYQTLAQQLTHTELTLEKVVL